MTSPANGFIRPCRVRCCFRCTEVSGEPNLHVMYGEVLPDGTRYLYDPQIGVTMSWEQMLQRYTGGAKTFFMKPKP